MATQATPKQIREFLGHGICNRKVRISRNGRVTYYGSTQATDRSQDFWHDGRFTSEYRATKIGDNDFVHVT